MRSVRACQDFIGDFPQQQGFASLAEAQRYANCISVLSPADAQEIVLIKLVIVSLFLGAVIGAWIGYRTYEKNLYSRLWERCFSCGFFGVVATSIGIVIIAGVWFVFSN